jgi:hypothetical protein
MMGCCVDLYVGDVGGIMFLKKMFVPTFKSTLRHIREEHHWHFRMFVISFSGSIRIASDE